MKSISMVIACLALIGSVPGSLRPAAGDMGVVGWRMGASNSASGPLHPLSGADGVTQPTVRAGSPCLATRQDGSSPYLYFALDAPGWSGRPAYVSVQYFDNMPGGTLSLEYDSEPGDSLAAKYHPAEGQAGGWALGTRRWQTVVFRLDHPRFGHRQNLGADFRLTGTRLFVRAVRLTRERPAAWAQAARLRVADLKPLVRIGPGGQLIVGGFDPSSAADAPAQAAALERAVPALKSLGVTSHEVYVRWNLCEPAPGRFDWSVYDPFVRIYKRYGLKWVPFLIAGSAYSLPDWYYKKPGSQGYVCLEHGKESDVQSLWNPVLRKDVAAFIRAFCAHYGARIVLRNPTGFGPAREAAALAKANATRGRIEAILLGITGNYGEAIYPATGNDWTASVHGHYHTHPGYWAGDPYAVASFRRWVQAKYRTPAMMSRAWGTPIASFAAVRPFLRANAPNDRAWLDFTTWYIGSMTDWARFWLKTTRDAYPGQIYLCTGGDAVPQHGSDFGEQCKAAASVGAGVRITNEGSDYAANFSLTRWVASAGRQYGAYFSFEPAGGVDPNGVISRIYNATASGARGLHYYYPNLFGNPQAFQNFVRFGSQFRQRRPVVEIGVYYPETHIRLQGNDFLRYVRPLRDRFDFSYVSDGQILDGGLSRVKALILMEGNESEASVWNAVVAWVRRGGLLLYPDGMGHLRSVEGNERAYQALLGPHAKPGRGRVLRFAGSGDSAAYREFLAHALARAPELSEATRAMVTADGVEDGVFVTLCAPRELLWLNTTRAAVVKGGVTVPAHAIASSTARVRSRLPRS